MISRTGIAIKTHLSSAELRDRLPAFTDRTVRHWGSSAWYAGVELGVAPSPLPGSRIVEDESQKAGKAYFAPPRKKPYFVRVIHSNETVGAKPLIIFDGSCSLSLHIRCCTIDIPQKFYLPDISYLYKKISYRFLLFASFFLYFSCRSFGFLARKLCCQGSIHNGEG